MPRPLLTTFLKSESSSGIVLLLSTLVALLWANSPSGDSYTHFWHTPLARLSLQQCVNDALMVPFFLLVGLEIKRELLLGQLASPRRAALPVAAALGGMILPALAYTSFNLHRETSPGWGIPIATDIAFAVGLLTLVGRSVPPSLKIFLLAVAIVDDLGAVLVIACFYTPSISLTASTLAAAFLAALVTLNRLDIRRPWPYLLLGTALWLATLASGIHPTIAGVLLAFTIPARPTPDGHESPLSKIEHALLRPVNFLILPLFALANAGVDLRPALRPALHDPVTLGIVVGLLLGKPLGILAASYLATKTRLATPLPNVTPRQLTGVASLCGIGFTMSLFLATLSFPTHPAHLPAAKLAILAASTTSALLGAALLFTPRSRRPAAPNKRV